MGVMDEPEGSPSRIVGRRHTRRGVGTPRAADHPHRWSDDTDGGSFDERRLPVGPSRRRTRIPWWQPWWTPLHRRLARHPTFASCTRAEIRRIARWGDEVEVDAGEVLVRRDKIGYWFFAIHSGHVALTRGDETVAALGPGDHFGDGAILGQGPQPATAVALTPCRFFVLGRQYLIGVTNLMPNVRRGLHPTVPPEEWPEHLRRWRAEGREAWRRLKPPPRRRARRVPDRPASLRFRDAATGRSGSFPRLAESTFRHRAPPRSVERFHPVRVVAKLLVVPVAALLAALLFFWHPPVVVISPGNAVDISGDLRVTGAPIHPVNGRYIMTPVLTGQPTLAELLTAWIDGKTTRPFSPPEDAEADAIRRAGRRAFADAHRHAVTAATAALGLHDPDLDVEFARRDLRGPSAGLVYAIALADLLTAEDLARGRTIAATGELTDDGTVVAVSHLEQKAAAARAHDAALFLVPLGQAVPVDGVVVHEVASLEEALEVLVRT